MLNNSFLTVVCTCTCEGIHLLAGWDGISIEIGCVLDISIPCTTVSRELAGNFHVVLSPSCKAEDPRSGATRSSERVTHKCVITSEAFLTSNLVLVRPTWSRNSVSDYTSIQSVEKVRITFKCDNDCSGTKHPAWPQVQSINQKVQRNDSGAHTVLSFKA